MGKKRTRNEFRKHKPSGHPGYIYHEQGNYYEFIGITHSNNTGKNIELDKNPEPGNSSTAYLKPCPEIDRKNHFGKNRLEGWQFADEDAKKTEAIKRKKPKKG